MAVKRAEDDPVNSPSLNFTAEKLQTNGTGRFAWLGRLWQKISSTFISKLFWTKTKPEASDPVVSRSHFVIHRQSSSNSLVRQGQGDNPVAQMVGNVMKDLATGEAVNLGSHQQIELVELENSAKAESDRKFLALQEEFKADPTVNFYSVPAGTSSEDLEAYINSNASYTGLLIVQNGNEISGYRLPENGPLREGLKAEERTLPELPKDVKAEFYKSFIRDKRRLEARLDEVGLSGLIKGDLKGFDMSFNRAVGNLVLHYPNPEGGVPKSIRKELDGFNPLIIREEILNIQQKIENRTDRELSEFCEGQYVGRKVEISVEDFEGKPEGHVIFKTLDEDLGVETAKFLEVFYCHLEPSGEKTLKSFQVPHNVTTLEKQPAFYKEFLIPNLQSQVPVREKFNKWLKEEGIENVLLSFEAPIIEQNPNFLDESKIIPFPFKELARSDLRENRFIVTTDGETFKINYLSGSEIKQIETNESDLIPMLKKQIEYRKVLDKEMATYTVLKEGLGLTSSANKRRVVKEPENKVDISDLIKLFDGINFEDPELSGYVDPTRLKRFDDGAVVTRENLRTGLVKYVTCIKQNLNPAIENPMPLTGAPTEPNAKKEFYTNLLIKTMHIVNQLNASKREGKDLDTLASSVLTLAGAGNHCGSRFVAECSFIFEDIVPNELKGENQTQSTSLSEDLVLRWVDEKKSLIMRSMIDPNNEQNAHEEIFYQKSLYKAGIRIPGGEDSLYEDVYERTGKRVYSTEEAVNQEFMSRMNVSEIVTYVMSRALEETRYDGEPYKALDRSLLIQERIQGYTEGHLLTAEEKSQFEQIEKFYQTKKEEIEEKFKGQKNLEELLADLKEDFDSYPLNPNLTVEENFEKAKTEITRDYASRETFESAIVKWSAQLQAEKQAFLDKVAQQKGLYSFSLNEDTFDFDFSISREGAIALLNTVGVLESVS